MNEKVERIIQLLEEILLRMERSEKKEKRVVETAPTDATKALIQAYCDAYKSRYDSYPIISGKTAGQAKTLLKAVSIARAKELVQAYLQMENSWFKTKCHDFSTFVENVGPVAVALHNGTGDPQEKAYWKKVFGGEDDSRRIPGPNNEANANLGRKVLPAGTNSHVLARLQKREK